MFSFKGFKLKKNDSAIPAPNFRHQVGNVWENPKVLEVNLIKENAQFSFDWGRKFSRLGLSFLIAAFHPENNRSSGYSMKAPQAFALSRKP